MSNIAEKLQAASPGACALIQVTELISLLQLAPAPDTRLSASAIREVTSALDSYGFGIEPDPAFAGPVPAVNSKIVLFRKPNEPVTKGTSAIAGRIEVEIAAMTAAHDGTIDADEVKDIVSRIKAMPDLSRSDQVRLMAFLAYLVANPPSDKAIDDLAAGKIADRTTVADVAFETVARTGELTLGDVTLLEKTYVRLGLPNERLAEKISERKIATAESEETLPLVQKGVSIPGSPIPQIARKVSPPDTIRVRLDDDKISKIREDTNRVSELLSQVFVMDEPGNDESDDPKVTNVLSEIEKGAMPKIGKFAGLEPAHVKLLIALSGKGTVGQHEFAALARQHGLMPAGAMEAINDWSIDMFDEPLLDGDDSITIAQRLIDESASE